MKTTSVASCIAAIRLGAAVALVSLAGCLSAPPLHPAGNERPEMRPEVFFAGLTHGTGELETRGSSPRPFQVEGVGRQQPDGTFRLAQTVKFADGEVRARTWVMRKAGPDAYTATLSDAAGDVAGETRGNLFHLRYLLRQPAVYMEQWLYLQPDGKSVINIAEVTIAGIPWARLAEQITRDN